MQSAPMGLACQNNLRSRKSSLISPPAECPQGAAESDLKPRRAEEREKKVPEGQY